MECCTCEQDVPLPEHHTDEEDAEIVLKGGQNRTVFRLNVAMERLEAVFNYETGDALPLGTLSVEVSRVKAQILALPRRLMDHRASSCLLRVYCSSCPLRTFRCCLRPTVTAITYQHTWLVLSL